MAIYNLHMTTVTRSKGRSVIAAAAYQSGSRLVDLRTGLVHDYTRRAGVVHAEIVLPAIDSGQGKMDQQALWSAADSAETRKNSVLARGIILALPAELSVETRQKTAVDFGRWLARTYGVAVDVAIHLPDDKGDQRNHHAHLLMTTRRVCVSPSGSVRFGEKTRELDSAKTGSEHIRAWRTEWETIVNKALAEAGRVERVDARSLRSKAEAEGLLTPPAAKHLGPAATQAERRGVRTAAAEKNREIYALRRAHTLATKQLRKAAFETALAQVHARKSAAVPQAEISGAPIASKRPNRRPQPQRPQTRYTP